MSGEEREDTISGSNLGPLQIIMNIDQKLIMNGITIYVPCYIRIHSLGIKEASTDDLLEVEVTLL